VGLGILWIRPKIGPLLKKLNPETYPKTDSEPGSKKNRSSKSVK